MKDLTIVLDAMGVLYTAADDVAELLVPFVQEKGGTHDAEKVARQYTLASLGEITPESFWSAVGLSHDVESEYLSRHYLTAGLIEFVSQFQPASLWCLSNDVAQWSRKLRRRHQLEQRFCGFVISGDAGVRKPDPAIYRHLIRESARPADSMLFVDDREKNLDAARELGFHTVLFGTNTASSAHALVDSFDDLAKYLRRQYNVP